MSEDNSRELTEHFFRNEYGKLVSVITGYIGTENVQTAEDIVQDTLLKAVDHWQHNGIPTNPQAWLYTTAKNLTLNILKRKEHLADFVKVASQTEQNWTPYGEFELSEELIADEQLKMMFVCCQPRISEKSQICLILKILCGFSIAEIAQAFFTSKETINKRLVRGRKQLRINNERLDLPEDLQGNLPIVLKTIFLLFNEGYSPSQKNEIIRYDLCLEAIRLTEILVNNERITEKADCYSLLALMYLNASRFDSRMNPTNEVIEMDQQDRQNWNQDLINKGIHYLNLAMSEEHVSVYLILATISANHCVATSFEETNWKEILRLYDSLIELEDSPIAKLNRIVALSKVEGHKMAIKELKELEKVKELNNSHRFHSTLAELYKLESKIDKAEMSYRKAISLCENKRDLELLLKKMSELVPD